MRFGTPLALATVALASTVFVGSEPAVTEGVRASEAPVVLTRHPELSDALARIAKGSASWRAAMASLASSARRAVLVTPDDVVVHDAATGAASPFDRSELAEVAPVADAEGRVGRVLVVVNVERLQQLHARLGSLPGEFHADLERVLAHEIYGHAVPYLQSGHLSGRCSDPEPGAPATDACAIRRENVIRAELGLGRRTDAGLASLLLLRRPLSR